MRTQSTEVQKMIQRAVVLLLGLSLLLTVPAAASGRSGSDTARSLAEKALRESTAQPGCSGQLPPSPNTTDRTPPAEVLRRYELFRNPQPQGEGVLALPNVWGGLLASGYERTRTLSGVRVTVAPVLDWTPSLRPKSCDAFALKRVRALVRSQPRDVRHSAVGIVSKQAIRNDRIRRLPPRTLLLIGSAASPGSETTGALTLSAQRGLYALTTANGDQRTAVGLIPDGVTSVRFRAAGNRAVTAAVSENLVVAQLPWRNIFGHGRQTLWLDASGKVVKTIGKPLAG